jgi:hypothetical protein
VLGGLFTSTSLTLVMLPALYAKFGKGLFPKPVPALVIKNESDVSLAGINSNA